MSEPIWNKFLTERDKQVFAAAGYGARAGFGQRPALIVIDVSYAFCGDKPEPILDSIKRWRNSCGEESWVAIALIRKLIDKAHQKMGYARSAMLLMLAELKASGFDMLTTSVVRGEHSPIGFYLSLGFVETNETTRGGEWVLQRAL